MPPVDDDKTIDDKFASHVMDKNRKTIKNKKSIDEKHQRASKQEMQQVKMN
jgi:hypothetical protein